MIIIGGTTSIEPNNSEVSIGPVNVITVVGEHCVSLCPIRDHNTLEGVMLQGFIQDFALEVGNSNMRQCIMLPPGKFTTSKTASGGF